MRPPAIRITHEARFQNELVVDNFAGGGGASTGIEAAIGRPVDIAINHDPTAISMHRANHPETRHYCESIWEVDPKEACQGRPVGLAWFSPDCKHFSRAKGTTPKNREIRALAWVVVRWARDVRPRVIILENVEEFRGWGPLDDTGHPDPARVGETFNEWFAALSSLGYTIEFRSLVAADYGTPTTRRRLFLIARRDRAPIIWPEATHGDGREHPWRPAAEVIDWSLPCRSIFDRKKPLAEATMRRIAAGVRRYVLESANPFILPLTHQGDSRVHDIEEPLRTITAAHRGEFALCSPTLIQKGYGERKGQAPRALDIGKPLGTVVAGGIKHNLVMAFLAKHYGGHTTPGTPLPRPMDTVTAKDHHSLVTAFMTKYYGTSTGARLEEPVPTILSGGGKGGGHLACVQAFLLKYYGAEGRSQTQQVDLPLHTVTTRARFGLVTIQGEDYQIADIGMRMLEPHELFAAQGFPKEYQIAHDDTGRRLTKTAQIALAGNSVCPPVARALVEEAA